MKAITVKVPAILQIAFGILIGYFSWELADIKSYTPLRRVIT